MAPLDVGQLERAGQIMRQIATLLLPGMLVAATGVGAGDLATASFAGSHLGIAVLWAVVVGGVLKLVLTEGLARWQLVSGQSLLEGVARQFGAIAGAIFLPFLLLWSFFVGAALISACGVTLHAIFPLFDDAATGKIVFGVGCSLLGLLLVRLGGFALFEKIMALCIGVMFITVLLTAGLLWPGTGAVLKGLLWPTIPPVADGVTWTVALIGGVGGTVTVLCYGYWIREAGRHGAAEIASSRIDLAAGYGMTVLFGIAMVIIGSTIEVDGRGAGLLVSLAERLAGELGPTGRWLFLVGAFGAVFSSLLGVWQAVPYIFADSWRLFVRRELARPISVAELSASRAYRTYLWALALLPMAGLLYSFKDVQKFYAVIGAGFLPMLAIVLLLLNGRKTVMGPHRNGPLAQLLLLATLLFFLGLALRKWLG